MTWANAAFDEALGLQGDEEVAGGLLCALLGTEGPHFGSYTSSRNRSHESEQSNVADFCFVQPVRKLEPIEGRTQLLGDSGISRLLVARTAVELETMSAS